MRRVVFVLPSLNSGGAERVAINYLRQLELEKYAVTLAVFLKTTDLLPLITDGVQMVDLHTGSTSRSFWALLKLLRQLKPDVVFTTHSRIATLLVLIKPFAPKFRHIARMQSTPSLEKKYGAYGASRRKLYSVGFRSADVVIAQTEAMKEDGITSFGLKPDQVRVLPNPVDTIWVDQSLADVSSPFPSGQVGAVASGRLAYPKAFDVLIPAIPSVLDQHPNFVLYILGNDNGEGKKLEILVKNLGLEANVKFLGFQSNPYRYYAFCDLFILSSRWEGFPNVLLENYYLNTPVVATRCVPVVEELIKDGVNGSLCEPESKEGLASAICRCLSIHRADIKNPPYKGGSLETLL